MQFSPDGSKVAAGCADSDIHYFAKTENNSYKEIHEKAVEGHKASIKSIDWSADSKYTRSTCAAYEILFTDSTTGKRCLDEHLMAELEWATESAPIAWSVRGIWTQGTVITIHFDSLYIIIKLILIF